MNEQQMDAVIAIARRQGVSFNAAADQYMLYGTGEKARREQARDEWNAAVDARKAAKGKKR